MVTTERVIYKQRCNDPLNPRQVFVSDLDRPFGTL